MLEKLDLSDNSLHDTLSKDHLLNLSRLKYLFVSSNLALTIDISSNWIPPFQIKSIDLSSCKLGPEFPKWLFTQTNLSSLDISNANICDTLPPSLWNSLSSQFSYLNLSHNNIYGELPPTKIITSYVFQNFPVIDLSSNLFEGTVPSFSINVSLLFLNNNRFTDVTPLLCPKTKMVMSNLDFSNNLLSGELPNCWTKFDQLSILYLQNNNFSGSLPISISALQSLQLLHLRNNSFSGELITLLENCAALVILDAGYNSFTGYIPIGFGYTFKNIGILNLRSNHFFGRLPVSICELSYLQILDLSSNHISGTISKCIYKLEGMANATDLLPHTNYANPIPNDTYPLNLEYGDTSVVMWKGKEQSFKNTLGLVKSIDVSNNELEGHIPSGISSLKGLVSLDLSGNNLTGSITSEIGQLRSLEFLDLSSNHLSGHIPTSLASLSLLGFLDLSNNSLSGQIPSGTQLQGFDVLAYMGNSQLCGPPLPKCDEDHQPPPKADYENEDENSDRDDDIFPGLYISVVFGFIVGFWGVCGTLVLKRSWRVAYFRCVDDMKERMWRKS